MALQNLDAQFLDKYGDVTGGDLKFTQSMIDDWYVQSCRAIVNRVQMYNNVMLWAFASEAQIVDNTGLALDDTKSAYILDVTRFKTAKYKYPCRMVPGILIGQLDNPDSLYYAYDIDPACYFKNGALYIEPAPTATEIGYVSYVKLPTEIDASAVVTINGSDSCIFPVDLDHTATLWCVIQGKMRALHYYNAMAIDEFAAISGLTQVTSQGFTGQTSVVVAHNAGQYPLVQVLDENDKIIGPNTVEHTSINSVTVTFIEAQTGTVLVSVPNAVGGDLANFTSSLPTWADPTPPSMPTPIVPGTIEAMVKALPAYAAIDWTGVVAPSVLSLPTKITPGDFTAAAKSLQVYAALDFSGVVAPTSPTLPTAIVSGDVTTPQTAPVYSTVDFTGITAPALTSELATDVPAITVPGSFTRTFGDVDIARALLQLDEALSHITSEFDSAFGDDDVEKAREATAAINAAAQAGRAEVEAAIAEARGASEEIGYHVGDFNGSVQAYATRVNGAIAEYRAEIEDYVADLRKMIGAYEAESKADVDKFTADSQSEVSIFKAEIDADIAAYRSEAESLLGKYRGDVEKHIAEVRRVVETYAQENKLQIDLFTAELSEREKQYRAETEMDISAYKAEADTVIADFQATVQRYSAMVDKTLKEYDSQNKFQIDLFISELKERIDQYNAEQTADINSYQAEVQAVISEYNALVNAMVEEFKAGISLSMAHLEAAKLRMSVVASYTGMTKTIPDEIMILQRQFDDEIRAFCGTQPLVAYKVAQQSTQEAQQ